MTTSIDRLVARAMDRAPVARPVIAPLFARAAREPAPLEALESLEPEAPAEGAGRAGSHAAPSDAPPSARRGSLEQWLATHAPDLAAAPSRTRDDPAAHQTATDRPPRVARGAADVSAQEPPAPADVADDRSRAASRPSLPAAGERDVGATSRDAEAHTVQSRREPPLVVRASRPPREAEEAPAADGPTAAAASERQAPVRVTIGRVVVRAVLPPAAPAPPPAPVRRAGPTLEEYLARGRRP